MTMTFAPGWPSAPSAAVRTRWANSPGESSAVSMGWMRMRPDSTSVEMSMPRPVGPLQDGLQPLVEGEDRGPLAAGRRGPRVLDGERRFAAPGRAEEHGAGAVLEAAAQQGVQLAIAGLEQAPLPAAVVLGGDEPGEDVEPARAR